MSFLPHFASDLFISYSQIDDKSPIPSQKGWISTFQEALTIRLEQLLGTSLTISQGQRERNKGDLNSVGVLVSVVSPAYVNSQDCLNEINTFIDGSRQSGGLTVDNKPRIFRVTKIPVVQERQPSRIQRTKMSFHFANHVANALAHHVRFRVAHAEQAGDD